jgi:hypothetical protein
MKLQEHWEEKPTEEAPKTQAFAGGIGAPLLLIMASAWLNPGLILLKKAALAGFLKATSVAGGVAGYSTATVPLAEIRKTCLKAIDAFEEEDV